MISTFITNKQGEVMLNDVARHVKGCLLVPASTQLPVVVAAGATNVPGISPPIVYEGPNDGVAEIYSLIGQHLSTDVADVQDRFTVEITETMYRRRLMNRAILARHVFGTTQYPFFLPESLFLENQGTLQFTYSNPSASGAANFYAILEARKFQQVAMMTKSISDYIGDMRQRKQQVCPYWLTSDQAVSIPAGGKATVFFTATEDIMLALFFAMAHAISAGVAGDTQEKFTVQFFDAESERPLQNQPVAWNCAAGSAQRPYVLPTALMMNSNTRMRAEFTNLITDAATEVFYTFHGAALFEGQIPSPNHLSMPGAAQRGA